MPDQTIMLFGEAISISTVLWNWIVSPDVKVMSLESGEASPTLLGMELCISGAKLAVKGAKVLKIIRTIRNVAIVLAAIAFFAFNFFSPFE